MVGVAVWGSADAERFSSASLDPTLRRLHAPLSGATKQGRPYGALGATRRVGDAVAIVAGFGLLAAGGVAVRLLQGSSPTREVMGW